MTRTWDADWDERKAGKGCPMCAETLWWRCHRRMIADRLTLDGWTVMHLFAPGKSEPHVLWDAARTLDGHLVYDAGALPLPT